MKICDEYEFMEWKKYVIPEYWETFTQVLNRKMEYIQNASYIEGFRYAIAVLEDSVLDD